MELRAPAFSSRGLALCNLPSPTDSVFPVDHRSARQSITDLRSKEIPSPTRQSIHRNDISPPTGSSVFALFPHPSLEFSVNSISPTYTRRRSIVISHIASLLNEAEEPGCADPQSRPPTRERRVRPASLVLRPASSGGPALQSLSPPPIKVSLPARRGITLPRRLSPAQSPRTRSRRSIRPSQVVCESAPHTAPEPVKPASVTAEEGLIQLQIHTQQADDGAPLVYRRSFRHVRELNSPTLPPTASLLPRISITTTTTPLSARLDSLDDAKILSGSQESLIEPVSASSSDESEPLSTPPDDTVPDLTITRGGKGSSAGYSHPVRAREDSYASSFLDFEPTTPLLSPPLSATKSLFALTQSRLFTSCGLQPRDSVDKSAEWSYADAISVNSYEERGGVSSITRPIPGVNCVRSSKTRPSPLSQYTQYTDTRSGADSDDVKMGGGGIMNGYSTGTLRQSLRRRSGGVRRSRSRSRRPRSRSGGNATKRSCNNASEGSTAAASISVRPNIGSRMKDMVGLSPSGVARRWPNYQYFT